jgi:hypothetical protein
MPPSLGVNAFDNTHADLLIIVPAGNAAAYRANADWDDVRNRIHSVGCLYGFPPLPSGQQCSCP